MRLAGAGDVAFAPDLYHGKVADNIPDAEAFGRALDANYQQAQSEIAGACQFLRDRAGQSERGLTVLAFSLGAYYALALADADPEHIEAVILFYGSGGEDFSHSKATYLGHFAENDPYETPANVNYLEEALKRAGRPVTLYRYPGTAHWFFEPDRPEYNQNAADLAWERTLAFLNQFYGAVA